MNSFHLLLLIFSTLSTTISGQFPVPPPPPAASTIVRDASFSFLSGVFGPSRRQSPLPPPFPPPPNDDYYDSMPPLPPARFMGPPIGGGPFGGDPITYANLLAFANDKENFQAHGCGFDLTRNRCTDGLNLCKGACRDFSFDLAHDCRCVPLTFLNLIGIGK
ncbi:hypothetical protein M3Y99_00892100 [Aphelenchoides fujianensis]|nr:hypothetical protein M3Y99_00892100 [Aphelenchoides fujianensis]